MNAEIICFQGERLLPTLSTILLLSLVNFADHPHLQLLPNRIPTIASTSPPLPSLTTEHKARRDTIDKPTALPPGYDAFFSFPHGKGGYSGTCTYVRSSYAVPLKAEEGITGKLLSQPKGSMGNLRLKWDEGEMVGGYVGDGELEVMGNTDGTEFDLKRLDMEGRAVVLDFG